MPGQKRKKTKRFFSRSRWAIRIMRLTVEAETQKKGLVMIQIDGFSQIQFERAVKNGKMPFLKSLMDRGNYQLHSFYSGLSSVTPAVQGEIFYGVKSCVPSFSYLDRKHQRIRKMYETESALPVENELRKKARGLLEGGSSYSNIFTGSAREAHFCAADWGINGFFHVFNPLILPFFVLLYIDIFVRTFLLLIKELVISIPEAIKGSMKGWIFVQELQFLWIRVLACVLLREFVIIGAIIDMVRGLPIIHLNLIGYDEQAHRRGPAASFAHWSLRGIDDRIKRLFQKVRHTKRPYEIWIYSDHGQNRTIPYQIKMGCTLDEMVKKLFEKETGQKTPIKGITGSSSWREDIFTGEAAYQTKKKGSLPQAQENKVPSNSLVVAAMGPVGQIYFPWKINEQEYEDMAAKLINEGGIPLVMVPTVGGNVIAWTKQGKFRLPEQIADIVGADHPFISEIGEDIVILCQHPDAGDIVVCGWVKGETAITFPIENGSHGGLEPEETNGFALLPDNAPLDKKGKKYFRPSTLRETALKFRGMLDAGDKEGANV